MYTVNDVNRHKSASIKINKYVSLFTVHDITGMLRLNHIQPSSLIQCPAKLENISVLHARLQWHAAAILWRRKKILIYTQYSTHIRHVKQKYHQIFIMYLCSWKQKLLFTCTPILPRHIWSMHKINTWFIQSPVFQVTVVSGWKREAPPISLVTLVSMKWTQLENGILQFH